MDETGEEKVLSTIRDLLAAGRVVPVVGAGISAAVAGLPGWQGLIDSAISHGRRTGCCSEAEAAAAREMLARGELVAAAQAVKQILGAPGGEYPAWLKEQCDVGPERIRSRRLMDQIDNLLCPLHATTNYDRLLSRLILGAPLAVTWRQPVPMQTGLREGGRVLHLHGIFDDPESVVFGIDNYEQLIRDPAYQAVLRGLWLERTLLFLGCSFDGLEDPDFSRLLEWASVTFAGTPYRHYALLRRGSFTAEQARTALLRWRIQAVDFGPSFDDLPRTLERLCPDPDRAFARRVLAVQDLVASGGEAQLSAVADLLSSLARPKMAEVPDFTEVAQLLFASRARTVAEWRGDLAALQQLARSLVDPEAVQREIERWEDHQVRSFTGSFRETVSQAAGALVLIPAELLAALTRRKVDIHGAWLEGYCQELLRYLDSVERSFFSQDDYTLENMKRILTTLRSFLAVDPVVVFPEPRPGTRLAAANGTGLLVARRDRLELRRSDAPREILATLPLDLELRGADVILFRGEPVIVAFTLEHLIVWDPRSAPTALAAFQVEEAYGIDGMAHLPGPDGLRSWIATIEGPVYELHDFALRRRSSVVKSGLSDPTVLADGRLYGITSVGNWALVQVVEAGLPESLLTPEALALIVPELPGIATFWKRLFAEELEIHGDLGPRSPGMRFQHPKLREVRLNGDPLLCLRVGLSFASGNSTLLLFLDPAEKGVAVRGHFFLEDRMLIDAKFLAGDDGAPRVLGTLLSSFDLSYDLAVWARATRTAQGTVFIEEGSTLRTRDDLICVEGIDPAQCFASDDSGGLFTFSMRDRSYQEIDRDASSRIRALGIIRW